MDAGLQVGGVAVGNITSGGVTANADCACCGEGPPPVPECGRKFSACVRRYQFTYSYTRTLSYFSDIRQEYVPWLTEVVNITASLRGGPYKYVSDERDCPDSPVASGLLPVTIITETTRTYHDEIPPFGFNNGCGLLINEEPDGVYRYRRIEDLCIAVAFRCPVDAQGVDTFHYPTFQILGQQPFTEPANFGMFSYPLNSGFCTALKTGEYHNQWHTSLRSNVFSGTYNHHIEGDHLVDCGQPAGSRCDRIVENATGTGAMAYSFGPLEDCEGRPGLDCRGTTDTDCYPERRYLIGTPCATANPNDVPPQVVFHFDNVEDCGTVPFGGFCYQVGRDSPQLITDDPPENISDTIVDATTPKTCCECQPDCPRVVLSPRPCWLNGRRINGQFFNSNDRPDLVSPPQIQGSCCCRPDDIITLVYSKSDIVFLNQPDPVEPQNPYEEHWELCPVPISFRRDDPAPADDVLCPNLPLNNPGGFPGVLFSGVSNRQGVLFRHQTWPDLSQYEGCEWERMGSQIDFNNPQNSIGFYNNALFFNLPCPSDSGGELGGWRITIWNIAVTCGSFLLDARFEQVDGSGMVVTTLRNRLFLTIARNPQATGQPCTGGCVGGSSGSFVVRPSKVAAASGCGNCGNKGL